MSIVLTAENVSKRFRVQRDRPRTIREALNQRLAGRYDPGFDLWALRDISFSVERGRVVGIIGHNGAGKSTLLRLLSGLGRPSSGHIHIAGNVGCLLELGSGFHHDLTGRENLMTGGILTGLTRKEVKDIEEEIISFAELEEFIDQPVRTYSSGMYMRLAFATAIHFNPEILIIDEVLSVGDSGFQKKCKERLHKFLSAGKSLILVSHDLEQVRSLCNEVLVLEEGRLVVQSGPQRAIDCYHDLMRQRTEKRAALIAGGADWQEHITPGGKRMGTQEITLSSVLVHNDKGSVVDTITSGDALTISLQCDVRKPVPDFAVILGIYNEANIKCIETVIPSVDGFCGMSEKTVKLQCRIPELPLLSGRYYIDAGLYPPDWNYVYDYHWQMHPVMITANGAEQGVSGIVFARPQWSAKPGVIMAGDKPLMCEGGEAH